jgi:hypothetical protein
METEKKYTIFDFDKLSMNSTTGKARLRHGIYRNNPRITVYTNEPDDAQNNYGAITAALDPVVFTTYLKLLEDLSSKTSANNVKYKIENLTLTQKEDNRSRELKHVSDLFIGKDEEGVVWISVVAPNRPKFKFEFGNFPFHKFYKPDGSEMTKAELSSIAASATATLLGNIFSTYVTTNYDHMPATTYKKGGTGNRYGKKPAEVESEDLPF